MKAFCEKHAGKIHGVLSCFDRMLFRGYLPIMSGAAMAQFLQSEQVNFVNGHDWLARKLDATGVGYTQCDNVFVGIEDVERAQRFSDRLSAAQQLSAKVSRLLHRLHVHGLIAKVPHTRRWRVTHKGLRVFSSSLRLREYVFPELYAAAYA
jgi:uncharacterized lipoprotein YmbA